MLRRLLVALPVAALAAAALTATAAPATADPVPPNRTYVALGDSYAAGFGLPLPAVPTGLPVPGCAQTDLDYPHLVAMALDLRLTDVACSGAKTTDFTAPQTTPAGTAPAQLDIFKTVQPSLVTVTIGGNDLGFTAITLDCAAATPTGPLLGHPTFSSCKDYYASSAAGGGAASNPYNALPAVVAKVKAALKAVRAAAPRARIVVVTYPAIAPDAANTPAGGCFAALASQGGGLLPSALPFTDVDVPYLQVLQQRLDNQIAAVALTARASVANPYLASLPHSACSPESTRWIEPLVPGGGGTNYLHPSLLGAQQMASSAIQTSIR